MNRFYKYGAPPYINPVSTRSSSSSKEVVATAIPTDLITQVLNESLATGEVDITENTNFEDITGTTSIENISTSSLSAIDTLIRVIGGTRFESNLLVGSSTDSFDTNYSFEVNGNSRISGTNLVIDSEQVLIRDNCIGIGNSSSSLDNFINGIYFPKNDQFTGVGISPDKVGIISFPYGQFSNNFTYTTASSTKKRFSDSKTNVRFVYISDKYDFGVIKDSTTGFSADEQDYINSLNNIGNTSSSYYTNIEANNIVLHGGGIVSGLSKNLEIILTNSSNVESTFMTFDIINDMIDLPKSLQLSNTDSIIYNSGTITFNTSSTGNEYFKLGTNSNYSYRNLIFEKNVSDTNIVFNNQTNFGIYYQDTSTPVIYIDKDSDTDSTTLNSSLIVKGTNVKDYPNFSIENNLSTNIISTSQKPALKKYLQNLLVNVSSSATFTLEDITSSTSSSHIDHLITGYIIFTNANAADADNKHLHLRIEGSFSSGMTTPHIIKTIISKKNINITDLSTTSDLFITFVPSIGDKKIDVTVTNNLTSDSIMALLQLDIIST